MGTFKQEYHDHYEKLKKEIDYRHDVKVLMTTAISKISVNNKRFVLATVL
ncbi:hypothetical protein ACV7JQ_06765 [Globicatella sulfidifaciens]